MPSKHPRVGLVRDAHVDGALQALRTQLSASSAESVPDAKLAVRGLTDGAALGAILGMAGDATEPGRAARRVVTELRALLPLADLPASVRATVLGEIDIALRNDPHAERRTRQLALLAAPDAYGDEAIRIADELDAVDRPER